MSRSPFKFLINLVVVVRAKTTGTHRFSTYSARCFAFVKLMVMLHAKSFCSRLFFTNRTKNPLVVKLPMFRVCGNKDKVFNSVIVSDAVDMVNHFGFCEKPSNRLFHYKPVLHNISSIISIWMRLTKNFNISTVFNSFPIAIVSGKLRVVSYGLPSTFGAKFIFSIWPKVNRNFAVFAIGVWFVNHINAIKLTTMEL